MYHYLSTILVSAMLQSISLSFWQASSPLRTIYSPIFLNPSKVVLNSIAKIVSIEFFNPEPAWKLSSHVACAWDRPLYFWPILSFFTDQEKEGVAYAQLYSTIACDPILACLPNAGKDCVKLTPWSFVTCGSGHDPCSIHSFGTFLISWSA